MLAKVLSGSRGMATLVIVAVALGGDASTASLSGGAQPNPAPAKVVVTGDANDTPAGCRPHRIGSALLHWNRALNAADIQTLRKFWKEEREGLTNDRRSHARGTFKWFSLTDSPSPTHEDHFAAFQPRRALRYVRKRRGFRLQLTDAIGNGGYQACGSSTTGAPFR